MELKNFLSEFEGLSDERPKIAEQIKNYNLPVIVFGAAARAKIVTDNLSKYDIEVAGYAVDAEYYKPNQTYLGKPIYNFAELSAQPDKYVFILGVGSKVASGKRAYDFQNEGNIIRFNFDPRDPSLDCRISGEYIAKNATGFVSTYKLFEDDLSRKIMLAYLKTHLTLNWLHLEKYFTPDQYFNELTSKANRGGVFGLRRVHR